MKRMRIEKIRNARYKSFGNLVYIIFDELLLVCPICHEICLSELVVNGGENHATILNSSSVDARSTKS